MSLRISPCMWTPPVLVQVGKDLDASNILLPSVLDDLPVFAAKVGRRMSAISGGKDSNQPSKGTRRVTFLPEAPYLSPSGAQRRSVPVAGLFGPSPSTPLSKTSPSFASKSGNPTIHHRDPFSSGSSGGRIPSRLSRAHHVSSPRAAFGSGNSNTPSSSSRFEHLPGE